MVVSSLFFVLGFLFFVGIQKNCSSKCKDNEYDEKGNSDYLIKEGVIEYNI
jgi:hypothetical protein